MGAVESKDAAMLRSHLATSSPRKLRQMQIAQQRRLMAHLNPGRQFDPSVYEEGNESSIVYARNPLCDAVALCDMPTVEALLLDPATDVNAFSEEGEAALHIATRRGHVRLMEALLRAGARVNGPDRNGFTPLHHAIQCDLRQAKVLLDNFFPADQAHPLTSASSVCIASSNEALMELLLQHGASPSAASLDGTTCLHFALRRRMITESVLLLKSDKNRRIAIDLATATGETPLHLLAGLGVVNILDAVLKAEFCTPSRAKQPNALTTAINENRQNWHDGYELPFLIDALVEATSSAAGVASVGYPLPPNGDHVMVLHPETPEEAMALARNCWVGQMQPGDKNGTQCVLRFPVPLIQRQRISLASMLSSDRFRTQGLIPAPEPPGGDMECHMWTPARMIDAERLYVGVVQRNMRVAILHELGSALSAQPGRDDKAPAAAACRPCSPEPVGVAKPLPKPKNSSKPFLSFDLFCDLLDRLESLSTVPQAEAVRQTVFSEEDPIMATRNDSGDVFLSTPVQTGHVVSPTTVASTSPAPTFHAGPSGQMNLRQRMQLMLGASATPTFATAAINAEESHLRRTSLGGGGGRAPQVTMEAIMSLLPVGKNRTICPLDAVMTSGTDMLLTPLACCNSRSPLVTPLSEKRCTLMLMSIRAQLLAEESFGFVLHD